MSIEAQAAATAEVLFAQIVELHKDDKAMRAYMLGELGIDAVCRNGRDLEMVFTQSENDPADPLAPSSPHRPPGKAFPLMGGCPPESYVETTRRQLKKLLNDKSSFEHLRSEHLSELMERAPLWKRDLERRTLNWLKKQGR